LLISENHTKHINTRFEQNEDFLNVKAGGTCHMLLRFKGTKHPYCSCTGNERSKVPVVICWAKINCRQVISRV
jgi:hypothetical protein